MSDDTCLFCKVLAGDIPSDAVAATERAYAFRDISPQAPTHVLVIPRVHVPTMGDLAESHPDDAIAVLTLAKQVAEAEGIADRYRLVCNNGAGAQQTVFHAHAHVLGGRDLTWPPG